MPAVSWKGTEILRLVHQADRNGPRMTFVTGGTGGRQLAMEAAKHNYNVSHLIGVADSGRSTRQIRLMFDNMPAIGDIRSRLIDLADKASPGYHEISELLRYRLTESCPFEAYSEFRNIVAERHPIAQAILSSDVSRSFSNIFFTHIRGFESELEKRASQGATFDFRGASIGNLFLTGAYFAYEQDLETAIELYRLLANIKEQVIPATLDKVHLAARMADDSILAGQHLITKSPNGPVKELWYVESEDPQAPAIYPQLNPAGARALTDSHFTVFSMGSFYTSILSTAYLSGMGQAIRESEAVKVFVANSTWDFETRGMTAADMARQLVDQLRRNNNGQGEDSDYITHIIANQPSGHYESSEGFGYLPMGDLSSLGIDYTVMPLAQEGTPYYNSELLMKLIYSLI